MFNVCSSSESAAGGKKRSDRDGGKEAPAGGKGPGGTAKRDGLNNKDLTFKKPSKNRERDEDRQAGLREEGIHALKKRKRW